MTDWYPLNSLLIEIHIQNDKDTVKHENYHTNTHYNDKDTVKQENYHTNTH